MRLRNVLFLTAVFALSAMGTATEDHGWVVLRVKDAGMSFEMPAKPKPVERKAGSPITAYMLLTGDGLMMAGYSDPMPFTTDKAAARKMLADFDKGMTSTAKLTPAGFSETTLQGRQARISAFQGEDGSFWRVVGVIHGDRIVFQLFIGQKDNKASPTAVRFFNSLKLESR